jgi:BlaI family transcriptional regulator, penicillinase repressor
MASTKLTKLELQIMETLWNRGACSVREIQEAFPEPRPAYTTVQTVVYRLETKKAVRIAKRISNANIFEAVISRSEAHGRVVDELLSLFGGRTKPVMAHLIQTGRLTLGDIQEAEKTLRELAKKERKSK